MKNYMIITYFVVLMISCASSKKTNDGNNTADELVKTKLTTESVIKNKVDSILPYKTTVKGYSGVIDGVSEGNFIIKSVEDLRKFGGASFIKSIKNIDFHKDILIAVIDQKHNTGGYSLEIIKLVLEKSNLVCHYKTTSPSPKDMVTMAFTQPYHFIQIPKTSKNIVFKKI